MRINKLVGIIVIMSVFATTYIQAQWITTFSFDNAYASNPFRLPVAESSLMSTFDYGLQYNFDKYSISYNGSFTRFDNMMDRNFYWHQFAVFGNLKNTEWGFYINQRMNSTDYIIYDYTNYIAYFNHNFQHWNMNFYWGTDLALNTYSELQELDNFEISTNFKMNKSFETGTTMIVGTGIEYKKYINAYPEYTMSEDAVSTNYSYLTTLEGPGGGGYGRGYRTYSEVETPSALQMQFWLRMAQSITPMTGLAVQYNNQFLLSGSNRDALIYADESQIFDDPMGYESQSIGSELTQMLPWKMKLKGAFYYTEKNYSTQGIYLDENEENYNESVLRNDTRKVAWFTLQKNIKMDWFGGSTITLNFTHRWLDNESNSYWYNYYNQYSNFGLSINF